MCAVVAHGLWLATRLSLSGWAPRAGDNSVHRLLLWPDHTGDTDSTELGSDRRAANTKEGRVCYRNHDLTGASR